MMALLRPHTPFADAIVKRQAERCGVDLRSLSTVDLPRVVPMILTAAHVFIDPIALDSLRNALNGIR